VKAEDLTGKVFSKLTVLSFAEHRNKRGYWNCICECGNKKIIYAHNLISGGTKACGCLSHVPKHGFSKDSKTHPLYQAWLSLRGRCNNPNNKASLYYSKKGIKVCERWNVFNNFLEDMLPTWSQGLSIDRINNNGDYEPLNCRWATAKQQNRNRSINKIIEYKGERKILSEWAELTGIGRTTISARLKSGLSIEEALETTIKNRLITANEDKK
jgi:hypothetical protein